MNDPCKERVSRARWRQAIASSLLGGLFGAVAGVLSMGMLGLVFGYSSVLQHADNLVYGLESLFAGAVLLAIMFGIPIGMPIGGILGLMIGGVVGARGCKRQEGSVQGAKANEAPLHSGPSKSPWLTRRRALAWAAAAALVGVLIAPIVSRRRELAELRVQGDSVQDIVAKLGGRPDFGPSYVRMVDLGGSSVTDEDFIKLTEAKGFRLVDRVLLGNTGITDKAVEALKKAKIRMLVIDLSGTRITDKALDHLVRDGQYLNRLILARTRITDVGLRAILDGAKIDTADFVDTKVTEAGVFELYRRIDLLNRIDYGDSVTPKRIHGRSWGTGATPRQ